MPAKLKNLEVTKVDFVDAGANQEANILLFKRKDGNPVAGETPPAAQEGKPENTFKRILATIAKALGLEKELAKGIEAESFDDKLEEATRRKITNEIWDVCYALEESLCSIIQDDEVPWESKGGLMEESLSQFNTAAGEMIAIWATGKTAEKIVKSGEPMTPERIAHAKEARAALDAIIAKAESNQTPNEPAESADTKEGETGNMRFDKSKLTPEELASLEELEKKAGVQEETPPEGGAGTDIGKGTATPPPTATATENDEEDIYKGLHPAIKAELEALRKFREAAEDHELREIAKKYEITGKKPDELVPMLKSLKSAGGDAYKQMIAVLDAGVEAFEKSGIFSEIGKKGSGSTDAWELIEKKADEIQKAEPKLTRQQAISKACEQNPNLVSEYEEGR